ncbi:hypothetical protein M3P36_06895 [Altererythrobacter sp. KTW20L]|uniref:hypothetical protein n=1 Tax=Altererythrobacter sp. KTW20L TaxID=2942210 RepID=UPI0020C0E92A|nr:hypothetical protein [Altererythrobacter sp. KTW20L]MCL6250771.1 hypothetical protein [Altererythrobacter sp. KTW20L]
MSSLWSLITVLGPILLFGAIIWATLYTKRARRSNLDRAERGAKEVREEIEEDPRQ